MSFDKQGHRGCRGLMPENTIPAFIKALEFNITTLELDTVITKDNKVLVSHEPFFNHEITILNGNSIKEEEERSYNIFKMDYSETLAFDVGLKPHPRFLKQQKIKANKPLLTDVIDAVEDYLVTHKMPLVNYNIETKCVPQTDNIFHPAPDIFVELLIDVVIHKKIQDRVIIQSFDMRTLQYLHKKYPEIKTSLLYEAAGPKSLNELLNDLGFVPDYYSPDYTTVNKEIVNECKSLGIKILPWTVNDLITIRKLKSIGVHGVISDYPNLFLEL